MRRRGRRNARGAWVAAFVVVALVGALAAAQFGSEAPGPAAATPGSGAVTGTAAATGTGTAATGAGGAGGGGTASATASATATAAATPTATATAAGGTGTEQGGPLAVVRRYFASLAAANYPGAYDLLAPAYRSGHTLAAFVTALPARAPVLVSATVTSVANFHATVEIAITPGGGGARSSERVQMVDVNAATITGNAARWRLVAPPAGAGG